MAPGGARTFAALVAFKCPPRSGAKDSIGLTLRAWHLALADPVLDRAEATARNNGVNLRFRRAFGLWANTPARDREFRPRDCGQDVDILPYGR